MASDVLTLKIKRVAKGVELFAKSPIIEDFIQGISTDIAEECDSHPTWGSKLKGYRLRYKIEGSNNLASNWGKSLFLPQVYGSQESNVNLAFLRSVGLREGVRIVIPGLYTDEQLNSFNQGVRDGVLKLCKNYLTPRELELTITTKEIV